MEILSYLILEVLLYFSLERGGDLKGLLLVLFSFTFEGFST